MRGVWPSLLAAGLLFACAGRESSEEKVPSWPPWAEGTRIDTLGVRSLAEGDTTVSHAGLTIIETTVKFPPRAEGGEVLAWEFFARELNPVKLIVVRYDQSREHFELVGESETVVPRKRGINRFALREPIPVGFGYMFGIVQPGQAAIPFKKVHNWKTLITTRPLERPLMRRESFVMYGGRYSVRLFWRPGEEGSAGG